MSFPYEEYETDDLSQYFSGTYMFHEDEGVVLVNEVYTRGDEDDEETPIFVYRFAQNTRDTGTREGYASEFSPLLMECGYYQVRPDAVVCLSVDLSGYKKSLREGSLHIEKYNIPERTSNLYLLNCCLEEQEAAAGSLNTVISRRAALLNGELINYFNPSFNIGMLQGNVVQTPFEILVNRYNAKQLEEASLQCQLVNMPET